MLKICNKLCFIFFTLTVIFSTLAYADESIQSSIDTQQESNNETLTPDKAVDYYNQAVSLIMSRYKFDVSKEDLYRATVEHLIKENPEIIYEVFSGLFGSLDKYTTYYSEEEMQSFITGISGEICGIGVMITTVNNGLLITNVYEDTPAMESGLMIGDIITKVGDINLAGLDISIAQSYVLGEPGTSVNLTINRKGSEFQINPVRRKVYVSNGYYQCLENDTIGYICLSEFDEHIADYTKGALSVFDSKNITDIILDLRNNPGGSLNAMVELCNLFVPAGPVINLEYKNPFRNVVLYSENNYIKYNLIVLINENSASASEAFAAAVQDSGAGIVVGSKSFGKGTMQNLLNLKIGGGIKITEAEFLSPNMRKINGIGVTPDVIAPDKTVAYENSKFNSVTYERILKEGDVGEDVMAIEQRYYALGLSVGIPDGIYDNKTYTAAINFQKITGLYPYGVTDITTQLKIEEVLNGNDVVLNTSLEKAIDIFKNDDWTKYKHEWDAQ